MHLSFYMPRVELVKQQGVTLIEVMVSMVIISMLVVLGVSTHRASVVKSQQNVGREFASHLITLQERHYAEQLTYTLNPEALGLEVPFESRPAYYSAAFQNCEGEAVNACVQVQVIPTTHHGDDNHLVIEANTRSLWREQENGPEPTE